MRFTPLFSLTAINMFKKPDTFTAFVAIGSSIERDTEPKAA